jgi:UDP-N-acetylmuramoyl-tripeptide--D-alanyl-D-alanine ligase
VAVLGEMLELGALSASLHADCGRDAAAAGLGLLVTVGSAPARALGDAAVAAGLPASAWIHADTSADAASRMASLVRPGDLVLVKGSRGTRTDLVVDRLLETGA